MKNLQTVLALLVLVALPLSLFARDALNPAYFQCMRDAIERREHGLFISLQEYHRDIEEATLRRWDGYRHSWETIDEDEQYDRQKAAEKQYRKDTKEARKQQRERDNDTKDQFSDDKRACKAIRKGGSSSSRSSSSRSSSSRSSSSFGFIGHRCSSSAECSGSQRCSTEIGECFRACEDPNVPCILLCVGRCIPR